MGIDESNTERASRPEPPSRDHPELDPKWFFLVRNSTARLFGAHVWQERTLERCLSAETFLDPIKRSPEWLWAIERGDLIPTSTMVEDLEVAFKENGPRIDLVGLLVDLEIHPYGAEAKKVRDATGLDLEFDPPESPAELPDELIPIASSIRYQDRLLILTPILATLSLALFCIALIRATLELGSEIPVDTLVVGSGTLLALSSFFLGPMDRALAALARRARDPQSQKLQRLHATVRNDVGFEDSLDRSDWFYEPDLRHVIPAYRDRIRSLGHHTELSERLLVPVGVTAVLMIPTAVAVIGLEGLKLKTFGFSVAAVTLMLLTVAIRRTATQSARLLMTALRYGTGQRNWDPDLF